MAMERCQCLERRIALFLATVHGPGPTNSTREEFDELLHSLFGRTFGNLLAYFRKTRAIPEEMEERLVDALKKRNWLAHNYFWERSLDIWTSSGRAKMNAELKEHADALLSVEHDLAELGKSWRLKHGVTDEMIADIKKQLLQSQSLDDPPKWWAPKET